MPLSDWTWEPTDARDDVGKHFTLAWSPGMDKPVAIDCAKQLATGESLNVSNIVVRLWRLKLVGGTVDEDVTSATNLPDAATVSGTEIRQRVKSLEAGRVYRLKVLFGPGGNIRGGAQVIDVSEI